MPNKLPFVVICDFSRSNSLKFRKLILIESNPEHEVELFFCLWKGGKVENDLVYIWLCNWSSLNVYFLSRYFVAIHELEKKGERGRERNRKYQSSQPFEKRFFSIIFRNK